MSDFTMLQKEITETKYLSTENTYRYRPIMRYFYHQYEQAQNWLYKEDIFEYLKDKIDGYTLEDCERDLSVLVENQSLTTVQDVKNIQTLEDFKNKRFRYQMTDYAIAIEQMTIELEELEVKVASLSPKRFERLRELIKEIYIIDEMTPTEFSELWDDLTDEFKDLNQNYQSFLKKFQEAKTEELLVSTVFLEYKNKMITYLKDFIAGYLSNGPKITELIMGLDENIGKKIVAKLELYQREIPKVYASFNYEKYNEVNYGKWHSIEKWFVAQNEKSEGDRLLDVTNSIITQITKAASSLIELHGNMIARKEEYKHLCKLFDSKTDIKEAHELSSVTIGVSSVTHFRGISNLNSDSLILSYEVPSTKIEVEPHEKRLRREKQVQIISDKSLEKKRIIEEEQKRDMEEREILLKLINEKKLDLVGEVFLNREERSYILNLISRSKSNVNKENILGLTYKIENVEGVCKINSPDGIFTMPALIITFSEVN